MECKYSRLAIMMVVVTKKNVIVGYVFIIVFVNGEFIYKKNII